MKKAIALILTLAMSLSLAACSGNWKRLRSRFQSPNCFRR